MDIVSKPLAQFITKTKWEDLQTFTKNNMKMVLLDSIGCAIAGIATDPGKMAVSLAKQLGGPEESTIFGIQGKVSCVNAALANGQLINAIDYDAMGAGAHTPPYIIPPAIAMAERNKASGKEGLALHVEKIAGLGIQPFLAQQAEGEVFLAQEPRGLDDGGPAAFAAQDSMGRIGAFEDGAKRREVGGEPLPAGA